MDRNPYASVNAEIVSALSSTIPVRHDQYSGTAKTYGMFTIYNRIPEVNASGKNHAIGIYGDLDVFSDQDLTGDSELIATISGKLNDAGFEVLDIPDGLYDGVKHHVVIEFYLRKSRA